MNIYEILNRESISIGLKAEGKEELIDRLLDLAENSGKIDNHEEARKEIFARENIMSTGVGKGIALPHAKTKAVQDSVASMAIMPEPIDFEAVDGEPVDLAFLILGRENNVGTHLRLLSKISRLLNTENFRGELTNCKSEDEVLKLFEKVENE